MENNFVGLANANRLQVGHTDQGDNRPQEA